MKNICLFLILTVVTMSLGCAQKVQRYGSVIGVKEEMIETYKELHAAPWPEVIAKLKDVHIRNYSIYLTQFPDGNWYLFSSFEYTGKDFEVDMARMAADPTTQKWWKETDPCQLPLANRAEGEWWKPMEEVFHCD